MKRIKRALIVLGLAAVVVAVKEYPAIQRELKIMKM